MIFVSIASYRDSQLIPTIQDCLAKAARPEDLRFGICWQHGSEQTTLPFLNDSRFRILDVDWREARGCCWARAEIMKLYDGEDWFLQLDAHHRFVPGWDTKLIDHAGRTGSAKPILTGLTPRFQPDDPSSFGKEPLQTIFNGFGREGVPESFQSIAIPDWRSRQNPVRARFVTAGFVFAPGALVEDVPYNPMLYFFGEETMLTIRAFTHGYDFFHPTEVILWHQYATGKHRGVRPRHEDDHLRTNGVAADWWTRERTSNAWVKGFLLTPFVGPFGCGTVRTFKDYEDFAGVNFQHQCATDYTWRYEEPPNPPAGRDWAERCTRYEIEIHIEGAEAGSSEKATGGLLELFDERRLIYRRKLGQDELATNRGPHVTLRDRFASLVEPLTWRVTTYTDVRELARIESTSGNASARVRRFEPWESMGDWRNAIRHQAREWAKQEAERAIAVREPSLSAAG